MIQKYYQLLNYDMYYDKNINIYNFIYYSFEYFKKYNDDIPLIYQIYIKRLCFV